MSTMFASTFLDDHVGQIKTDPRVALIELIANSSDAGATVVKIDWPSEIGQAVVVEDNGIGMTKNEFLGRWQTLSYDRRANLGKEIIFPSDVSPRPHRSLFGKSGKGRHASFCFSDSYNVETWRDGRRTKAEVKEVQSAQQPFQVGILSEDEFAGHGTKIVVEMKRGLLSNEEVIDVIGSKFLIDPSFSIFVNSRPVVLTSINGIREEKIQIEDDKVISIIIVDSEGAERNNRLRGIAFWVNNRLVGSPSWKSILGGADYLDGRSNPAKRFAFVVKVDFLDQNVKEDWTGFRQNEMVTKVFSAVDEFIQKNISDLLSETRRERKVEVIEENKKIIAELPPSSRLMVGNFVDQVQKLCPSMKQDDMANAVQVFAKLEQARSGYELLRQLASCSTSDLEKWTLIIQKWDARQAQVVLDELEKRIQLVSEMRRLVNEKSTDELHELQPLFEQGLWIFGPQFETVEYVSNRRLKTIVDKFLVGKSDKLVEPTTRPDIVTSPVGVWDSSRFDSDGNVVGSERVLILELKRGGFNVKQGEVDQARDYALELRRAGAIQSFTELDCIVMGSTVESLVSTLSIQDQGIKVVPRTYDTVLRQADLRLFNLRKRIEELGADLPKDSEIDSVLSGGIQQNFL
jgi:hypothetical protein